MAEVTKVTSKVRHLAFWCVILGATLAFAAPRKISKDLQKQSSQQWVNVIVQYRVPPSQKRFAKVAAKGGMLQQNLPLINGAAFTVKGSSLAALAKDSNVAYISLDRTVWATATVTDSYDQAVLAPYAWSKNFTGSGIGVAVIDSGITAGRDFTLANGTGSRIVYNQNFASGPNTAADLYGHGTHVAGILAGNGMNSRGANFRKTFMGIADNASLINLRVLDQNGAGRDSAVIAAIEKAISLKSKYNIRVINLSLGRGVYESYKLDPLCQAVEAAWKAGIVVVVAAGNEGRNDSAHTDGYGTIAAPGNDPYAITVGAMKPMGTSTRADDLIASYSSKGPTLLDHIVKPDIVAPGNLMISVLASSSATLVKASPKNVVALSSYTANGKGTASYFTLERHQHGHAGCERSRRAAASEKWIADSGPGEGATDEERVQNIPAIEHCERSDHGQELHQPVRYFHRRRGISGHPGSTVEHGSGAIDLWDCEVPGRGARQEWKHLPGDRIFSSLGWLDHVGNFRGLGHVSAVGNKHEGRVGAVGIVGSVGLER